MSYHMYVMSMFDTNGTNYVLWLISQNWDFFLVYVKICLFSETPYLTESFGMTC